MSDEKPTLHLEEAWISFRRIVVAPDAGALQLVEMRRAFLAGADHLFDLIMMRLTKDSEADMKLLDDIYRELLVFRASQGVVQS